jgi:hypothetical protein
MLIIIILYLIFERKKIKTFTTLEFIISLLAIGDGTYNLTRFSDQLIEFRGSKKEPLAYSFTENICKYFFHLFIFLFILPKTKSDLKDEQLAGTTNNEQLKTKNKNVVQN